MIVQRYFICFFLAKSLNTPVSEILLNLLNLSQPTFAWFSSSDKIAAFFLLYQYELNILGLLVRQNINLNVSLRALANWDSQFSL